MNDNCEGWDGVKHADQKSSSMAAEYAPKGKGKAVNFKGFKQPGTPTEEKREEGDMEWRLDGHRMNATIGNAIAANDRKSADITTKDWAKRS